MISFKDFLIEFDIGMDARTIKMELDALDEQKKSIIANPNDPLQREKLNTIAFEERALKMKMNLATKMAAVEKEQGETQLKTAELQAGKT